jgi:hypothetical protein
MREFLKPDHPQDKYNAIDSIVIKVMVINNTNIGSMFLDMHEKQYHPHDVGNIQDDQSG